MPKRERKNLQSTRQIRGRDYNSTMVCSSHAKKGNDSRTNNIQRHKSRYLEIFTRG